MNPIMPQEFLDLSRADLQRAAARASSMPHVDSGRGRVRRAVGMQLVKIGASLVGKPVSV